MDHKFAIIDYGLGNLGSLSSSLKKIGAAHQITSDHEIIEKSESTERAI